MKRVRLQGRLPTGGEWGGTGEVFYEQGTVRVAYKLVVSGEGQGVVFYEEGTAGGV